jgi:hypothetical protein
MPLGDRWRDAERPRPSSCSGPFPTTPWISSRAAEKEDHASPARTYRRLSALASGGSMRPSTLSGYVANGGLRK